MSKDPSLDPIEAFIWLYGGLSSSETDVRKAAAMCHKIHTALSSDEALVLDKACQEALKAYQRRMMGTDREG